MRKISNKKGEYEIALSYHFLFWIGYFLINFIRWGAYYDDFYYSLKSNLVEFPIHIVISYFHAYYLIPKFIAKKKYGLYLFLLSMSLVFMYYAKTILTFNFVNTDVWPEAVGYTSTNNVLHFVTVVIGELYVIGFTTAIKLTYDWINSRDRNLQLEKINLETEIKYLRAQIQPHFFFNTLNNLYALTLDKSDKAPEVVLKLSELMQYVIYETKKHRIPLSDDISYIENYLELERLRYGDRLKYNLEISGDIDSVNIPPLLILPFIENCFKHGISADNSDIKITIEFFTDETDLSIKIKNPIPAVVDKRFRQENEGIGITNIEKRLKLNYPGKHKLEIKLDDENYFVHLKIPKNK